MLNYVLIHSVLWQWLFVLRIYHLIYVQFSPWQDIVNWEFIVFVDELIIVTKHCEVKITRSDPQDGQCWKMYLLCLDGYCYNWLDLQNSREGRVGDSCPNNKHGRDISFETQKRLFRSKWKTFLLIVLSTYVFFFPCTFELWFYLHWTNLLDERIDFINRLQQSRTIPQHLQHSVCVANISMILQTCIRQRWFRRLEVVIVTRILSWRGEDGKQLLSLVAIAVARCLLLAF